MDSFDRTPYLDICPFDEKGAEEACKRIKANPEYMQKLALGFIPGDGDEDKSKREEFVKHVFAKLDEVHSYDDFQHKITIGIFLPWVIGSTSGGFTHSGLEGLDPSQSYLFVSNHRDIILDCALLDYALFLGGMPLCEMAIGDNLLQNKFYEDIFKLNGSIIVRRSLPLREKYLDSIRLSEYFVDRIASGKSIWVAQKSGRSKDGIDETHPSIIKMLYLSKKGKGISFSDVIKGVRIVPVAISYENDPNDINKGREEVLMKRNGSYEKKKYEDTLSMLRGIRKDKGRIHIAFGHVLDGTYMTPDEVAKEIDRQIHVSYKLWPNNYFAYDYVEKSDMFKGETEGFDSQAFLSRFEHLDEDVREFVINSYANPVRKYLEDR